LQSLTGDHPGVVSPENDGDQQQLGQTKPTNLLQDIFGFPYAVGNLFGNVAKGTVRNVATGTQEILDNINPLKYVLPKPKPTAITTHARVRATEPADVLDGTGADSLQKESIRATTTEPTTAANKDLFGNILHGAQNVFDSVFEKKPPTTAIVQTRATVAPPAGGHGRGIPAILFNIGNIFKSILKLVGAILHWTEHSEPGYIISTFQSLIQSLEALKDIYLQRNMEGGIGEIPKHVEAILKTIGSLRDTIEDKDPGKIIKMFTISQTLFKDISKLEHDFIETPTTTPKPGGIIGDILKGFGLLGKKNEPHSNQNTPTQTNNTSLRQRYGEFGHVVQNTGKLIDVLGDIEQAIQDRFPDSIILQFIGKLKVLVQLCLTNNTLDDANILDVIQKVWFPNSTLEQIIGKFGKTLKQLFPKSDTARIIGSILEQQMIIGLGLNTVVRSVSFLRFGNIKYFILSAVGNVENEIIGNNLNKLLSGGIGALEIFIEILERLLKPITDFLF
jgi:hypothetical protein